MVEDFGHSGASLGYYAGGLAGAFCAAQFCSSVLWGWVSDKFGRKPAVFLGTLGTALGMIVFGTSRTYGQAVAGRVISGFLCGNLGVVKSFLTEVTDDTNRGKAFSLFSLGLRQLQLTFYSHIFDEYFRYLYRLVNWYRYCPHCRRFPVQAC
jgi:MFS family permease